MSNQETFLTIVIELYGKYKADPTMGSSMWAPGLQITIRAETSETCLWEMLHNSYSMNKNIKKRTEWGVTVNVHRPPKANLLLLMHNLLF